MEFATKEELKQASDAAIAEALARGGYSLKTMAKALSDMPAEMLDELREECGDKDLMLRWLQMILMPGSNVGTTKFGAEILGELMPALMDDCGMQESDFTALMDSANLQMDNFDMFVESIRTMKLYLDQGALINICKWQYAVIQKAGLIARNNVADAILKYFTGKMDDDELMQELDSTRMGMDMMGNLEDSFAAMGGSLKDAFSSIMGSLGSNPSDLFGNLGNLFGNLGDNFGMDDDGNNQEK